MRHFGAQAGAQARSMFDRLFPERQIIHRSCGAVRGVRLSPGKQALAALCATGAAGWCVFATASTMLKGPCPPVVAEFVNERANYQRWLDDVRGRAAATRDALEHATRQFDAASARLETRHDILRALLEYARGDRLRPPERRDAAAIMVAAINDAEPAHERAAAVERHHAEAVSLRSAAPASVHSARFDGLIGPRPAGAAAPRANDPRPRDFAAAMRDPRLSARVTLVAARIPAFRRLGYGY
jgi:hypothetical protein